MLQLVIIFYGPGKWFDFNLWGYFSDGRMAACVIAFVINYACYFAVIYKGGIESVPIGQQEAGQVLGEIRLLSGDKVVWQSALVADSDVPALTRERQGILEFIGSLLGQ